MSDIHNTSPRDPWSFSLIVIAVMFLIWALDGAVGDDDNPVSNEPFVGLCNEPRSQLGC